MQASLMEIFDLRQSIIPFSLLQISNCFQRLNPGEAIEIIGCDESVARDLKRILADAEYETIHTETQYMNGQMLKIRLTKKKE